MLPARLCVTPTRPRRHALVTAIAMLCMASLSSCEVKYSVPLDAIPASAWTQQDPGPASTMSATPRYAVVVLSIPGNYLQKSVNVFYCTVVCVADRGTSKVLSVSLSMLAPHNSVRTAPPPFSNLPRAVVYITF